MLSDEELRGIKMVNDSTKVPHGRPVKLINDLLETIYSLKKEKKKWQRLAEKRKTAINKTIDILKLATQNSEETNDSI